MSKDSKSRFTWIDYCKGLAIILVVFGHVNRGLYSADMVSNLNFFRMVDSVIYTFHMPLFFFLSGMLFFNTQKNNLQILNSKIDTIIYPFILWSLLQGGVEVLFNSYTNKHQSLSHLLYDLFVVPQSQFWFLYALFFCFVLALIIFKYIPKAQVFLVFLVSSLFYLNLDAIPDIFLLKILSRYFLFFILGACFYIYLVSNSVFNSWISDKYSLCVLLLLTILFQYIYHVPLGLTYLDVGLFSLVLTILTITTLVSICFYLERKSYFEWLIILGASSMAIYVMHVLIASGFRIFCSKAFNITSYPLHLIAGTLLGVIVPIVIMRLFEKKNIKYYIQAPLSKCLNISALTHSTK